MYDKKSAQEVIQDYRRRKRMAEQLPFFYTLVVVLIIVGGIYLVYRVVNSYLTALAPAATDTPAPTQTLAPTPALTPTSPPAQASALPPAVLSATSASGTRADTTVYTVRQGDTLAGIAAQFNVSLGAVIDLNPDLDPDLISVGQEILIPTAGLQASSGAAAPGASGGSLEYTVVEGDTLASIARRHNTTVAAIAAENNLENADVIRVGDILRIPASAAGPPTSATPAAPALTGTISAEVAATETSMPNP
jgi:LysM repeat protein